MPKKEVKVEEDINDLDEEDKKKYKIVSKTIFFEGNAFIIEEEISIDSDITESQDTSDDEFEVDDGIKGEYNKRLDELVAEREPNVVANVKTLKESLDNNRPKTLVNDFGRD